MPCSPGDGTVEAAHAGLLTDADALVRYLTHVLPPPGAAAGIDPDFGPLAEPPREAAVLLPLYARGGVPHVLFTLRAPTLAQHSGQISFPGGSRDREDADVVATAVREAHEEIGLSPEHVRILGVLSPVFTVVSNFLIAPVVGWIAEEPLRLIPNPQEVAEVIEVPLAGMADPAILHEEVWQRGSRAVTVYFYDYGAYRIWGATARIVHDFLRVLGGATG
jgi:8-oxo-dGTP pyrophosphatase MutT (NUDIX family)